MSVYGGSSLRATFDAVSADEASSLRATFDAVSADEASSLRAMLDAVTTKVPDIVKGILLDEEGRQDVMTRNERPRVVVYVFRSRQVYLSQSYAMPCIAPKDLLGFGVTVMNIALRAVTAAFWEGRLEKGMKADNAARERFNAFKKASAKTMVAKCIAIEFVLGAISLWIRQQYSVYPHLPKCIVMKAHGMIQELVRQAKELGAEQELCKYMRYESPLRNHRHNVHCSCGVVASSETTFSDETGCIQCWKSLELDCTAPEEVMSIAAAKQHFKIRNMYQKDHKGRKVIGSCWCVSCVASRFSWYMSDTLLRYNFFYSAPQFAYNPVNQRGHMQGEQRPLTERFLHIKKTVYGDDMQGNDPFSCNPFVQSGYWEQSLMIMDDPISTRKRQLLQDPELLSLLVELSAEYCCIVAKILLDELGVGIKRSRSEAGTSAQATSLHNLMVLCRQAGGSGVSGVIRKYCAEGRVLQYMFSAIALEASRGHLNFRERVLRHEERVIKKVVPHPATFVFNAVQARAVCIIAGAFMRLSVQQRKLKKKVRRR